MEVCIEYALESRLPSLRYLLWSLSDCGLAIVIGLDPQDKDRETVERLCLGTRRDKMKIVSCWPVWRFFGVVSPVNGYTVLTSTHFAFDDSERE